MYVSTKRLIARINSVLKCMLWLGLGLALALFAQTGLGQDNPDYLLPRPDVFRGPEDAPPQNAQQARFAAQQPDPNSMRITPNEPQSEFGDAVQDGLLFGNQFSGRTGEAYGVLGRGSVLTGPAVGRNQSIVPLEIMPYGFMNNAMVFGSLRGFRGTNFGWGMNLGGGIRYYSERWDRIWGANAYYDYDNSSGGLFRQSAFGLESLGALWDMRANAYMPNATTSRLLTTALVDGSQRFSGHNLLYDNLLTFGNALRGVDWELGVPIPGRIAQRHELKVFGGAYYYSGSTTPGFTGWKGRVQANVIDNLVVQLEVMNDQIFKTNVVFGATYTFGGYRQPEDKKRSQIDRMTEMVRRNYNIVVARIPVLQTGQIAINPNNNQPYFFEHVASYATGLMDGTVDHPWQNITQATTALNTILPLPSQQAGNIIYVHANSVYSTAPLNTVTLIPSVRILGEGNLDDGKPVQHVINVPNLGNILLPRATNFPNRPIFEDQAAGTPAVTLVSGLAAFPKAPSEFSGFQIGDPKVTSSGPQGIGILGNGVGSVVVNQTDVNFAQGDGVSLTNLNGPVAMLGTVINNVGNAVKTVDSLFISGGTGSFTFGVEPVTQAQSMIFNTGGYAVDIEGTARGSVVNMAGSIINDGTLPAATGQTGGGINLFNIDGSVTIGSAQIVNTVAGAGHFGTGVGNAIQILGTDATPLTPALGTGQISFVGAIAIDNAVKDGIHIESTEVSAAGTPARVTFILPNPVNGVLAPGILIDDRNAVGINMLNNKGNISFLEPVTITTLTAPLFPAIDFEGNSGPVSFLSILPSSSPNQILISGGGADGIDIGATTVNSNVASFRVTGTANIQTIAGTGIQIGNPNAVLQPPTPPITLPVPPATDGPVTFGTVSINNRGGRGIQIIDYVNSVQFTGTTTVANNTNSQATAVDIRFNQINPTNNLVAGNVTFNILDILGAQGPTPVPIVSGAGLNVLDNPVSVSLQQLNINQGGALAGNGTALYVDNAGITPPLITTTSAPPILGVSIGAGNITSNGGPAVNILNSVIQIQLTSVSSTASVADGLFLSNNVGPGSKVEQNDITIHPNIFTVNGVANGAATGGVVRGSTLEGAYILNSEGVQLKDMNFTGNTLNGIYATTPALTVLNNQITGNAGFGVDVYAIAVPQTVNNRNQQTTNPIFTMQGTTLNTNAQTSGSQEVLFTAGTLGTYTVDLGVGANGTIGGATGGAGQNTITYTYAAIAPVGINEARPPANNATAPATNDAVLIRTDPPAIGSILFLNANNNLISVTVPNAGVPAVGPADMRINWNGQVSRGLIEGNTFNFGANNAEGLVINLQSTNFSAIFHIAGDIFNSPAGTGTTGLDVTTNGGPSTFLIGDVDGFLVNNVNGVLGATAGNFFNFIEPNNILVAGNPNDLAMLFTLGANSNVQIFDNAVTMTGPNIEAIQFATVAGPSTAFISNNLIQLNDQGALGGNILGIEILAITQGLFGLSGTADNVITINGLTGSTPPWFFAPPTGTVGQISVNGALVP